MLIKGEPTNEFAGLTTDDMNMFTELDNMALGDDIPMSTDCDDLFEMLGSDLDIPMLLNGESSSCYESVDEIMRSALQTQEIQDTSKSFEMFDNVAEEKDMNFWSINEKNDSMKKEVKIEPKSPVCRPPHSPTPSQSDSISSIEWMSEGSASINSDVKFALETPPISPQPGSPNAVQTNTTNKTYPQVKLVPINLIKSTESTIPKYVISNNPAKRVCIQPKFAKALAKETPRKTIVLSQQDFEALAQRVKKNVPAQPIKVQAIPLNKHIKVKNEKVNLLPANKITTVPPPIVTSNQIKIFNTIPTMTPVSLKAATIAASKVSGANAEIKSPPTIVIKKNNSPPLNCPSIIVKNDLPVCTPIVINKENPIVIKKEYHDPIDYNISGTDVKAMKRQQRMIKNRESACLSRKKKKEHLLALETQVNELKEENLQLKKKNEKLKRRVSELESCSTGNTFPSRTGINKKGAAILLGMMFMVTFNIGNFGTVFSREPLSDIPHISSVHQPNVRRGRTLLWTEDENSSDIVSNETKTQNESMCMMNVNQTESIRLDTELRRWLATDQSKDNWIDSGQIYKTEIEVKPLIKVHLNPYSVKNNFTVRKLLKKKIRNKPEKTLNSEPLAADVNAVQVFSPLPEEYAKLFDALGRRKDTFYIIWFSGAYLRLPASSRNSTVRPRISIVLPTPLLNGSYSTPKNHVTMMQIDCEVINTQQHYISDTIIPEYLKNQQP